MPDPDLDLRLVRYFAAVAEHEHFGRAAAELRITQPSLSRQICHLEKQVGARLLDRTPRGSRLTEAGEAFLPLARELLRTAARATAQAHAAARPRLLTVGYTVSVVTPVARDLRRRRPDVEVVTRHLEWHEPRSALLDHRVDVVLTRMPLPGDGLEVTVLYEQPRVVIVPLDHRLAGKESVTVDDIADEPLPRVRDAHPEWSAFWRLEPRPDGRPAPDGPEIDAVEDKFEIVAAGQAVAISAAVDVDRVRPDLTTIPLEGVAPSQVVLANRAGDRGRLVAEFCALARAHLTGPPD